MNTQKIVTWLITYGTQLCPGTIDERVTYCTELMDGPEDTTLAETQALEYHVPETLEVKPEGDWVEMDGFRAFKFNDNHSELEDNSVYWVESMRVVDPADAPVLKEYLDRGRGTYESRMAERWEDLRLRGSAEQLAWEQLNCCTAPAFPDVGANSAATAIDAAEAGRRQEALPTKTTSQRKRSSETPSTDSSHRA